MSERTKYSVYVDDNFHYADESERGHHKDFKTYEAALAACREIVDDCLKSAYKRGMTADELMKGYLLFGEDPWIKPTPPGVDLFSARDYARQRATEMCGESPDNDS